MILSNISHHKYASLFLQPVKPDEAPGYYDVVKKPMSFQEVKSRIKEGVRSTFSSLSLFLILLHSNSNQ